MSIIVVVDINL